MDVEINLVKEDNDVWGFRLTGGAEYDVPFIVVHVSENGVAEKGGLKCNDVIESVNGISTVGRIHNDTHQLLLNAGNNLTLGIKRNVAETISPVTYDDESNEEVSNIMQPYLEDQEFEHQRQVHFEIIDPSKESGEVITQVLGESLGEPQIVTSSGIVLTQKEHKWSTFLQRPTNPKPVRKTEEETFKGEPYRVVIKKQPKKSAEDKDCGKEIKTEEETVSETEKIPVVSTENEAEISQQEETEENETQIADGDEEEKVDEEEEQENVSTVESGIEEQEPQSNLSVIQTESDAVLDKFLEEKLAEVQKQLEALSKLPSNFQSTIDALNKQLATIVKVPDPTNEDKVASEEQSDSENDLADQTITEGSMRSIENEEQNVDQEENDYEENDNVEQDKDTEQPTEDLETADADLKVEQEISEEEKEAKRVEQELLEKQEKEQLEDFKQRRLKQKPTLPLKPIERPIILPGGRRWSQPDDACPVVRQVKMSDEKIANTIETFSEVIVGKTKGLTIGIRFGRGPTKKRPSTGIARLSNRLLYLFYSSHPNMQPVDTSINFMKYQPPPKNLDYLQRSDVYKLVHDLEPPVRGISSRVSKILAEQDYYQAG